MPKAPAAPGTTVIAEASLVRGRVVGLEDAAVHTSTHMLDKASGRRRSTGPISNAGSTVTTLMSYTCTAHVFVCPIVTLDLQRITVATSGAVFLRCKEVALEWDHRGRSGTTST